MLTEQQIERYSRQIILPRVGGRGQERLLASRAVLVGTGTLGCAAAVYLAAAGIGALTILDDADGKDGDLDWGTHNPDRGGWKRAESAAGIEGLNPDCRIRSVTRRIDAGLAAELARDHDLVIDASGRPETSVLLNAATIAARKPLVWGTAAASLGQVTVFSSTPCYRCYAASPQASAATRQASAACTALGVIAAGFIGTLQATEAIKIVLGIAAIPSDRLLLCNPVDMSVRQITLRRAPDCDTCSAVSLAAVAAGSVQ